MKSRVAATVLVAGIALVGCAPESESSTSSGSAQASDCTPESLATLTNGKITVATGEPAYEPWVVNDDPANGEGFEAAVAYAVAENLGYTKDDVVWTRSTFDGAIAPGPKDFDWNLQQYSITADREQAVDFSSPYYQVSQAVISTAGSPIASATTVADLKSAKLGAAVGSTSLNDAQEVIAPTTPVSVFNDNAAAVTALKNGQIDGIVIDLPSAFYLTAAEIDNGVIVGQLPGTASGQADEFGILLAKDSPLTSCTSQAVDALAADGTLTALQEQWLGSAAGAPTLK
ncbi:MAG: polar amino acid transport system substrate-binding protein [Actinomycetota bacterium]|nr:polar amino acid transport system substrate-binding protein [Actinomycetota bacterium]